MDRDFENLRSGQRQIRQPNCPDPLVWYEIASGELAPDPTQEYLLHATSCDYCGNLLSEAVSDLNDEPTPAEVKEIASLESSRPKWQRRLAQRITELLSDEAAARRLAAAGQDYVRTNQTPSRMVEAHLRLYRALTSKQQTLAFPAHA